MRELQNETLFDKRLINRHITEGLIDQQDVDKHIKATVDATEESEPLGLPELVSSTLKDTHTAKTKSGASA